MTDYIGLHDEYALVPPRTFVDCLTHEWTTAYRNALGQSGFPQVAFSDLGRQTECFAKRQRVRTLDRSYGEIAVQQYKHLDGARVFVGDVLRTLALLLPTLQRVPQRASFVGRLGV
jgi:hypothetical protein